MNNGRLSGGYALPLCLAAIVLLTICAVLSFDASHGTLKLLATTALGRRAAQRELIGTAQALADNTISGLQCFNAEPKGGSEWPPLCAISAAAGSPPPIDLAAIFSSAALCPEIQVPKPTNSFFSSRSLTAASAVSPVSCTLKSGAAETPIVRGNLGSTEVLDLSGSAMTLIAATGYIDLAAQLTVDRDLVIVAIGDLLIKEIFAATPVRVLIVSVTGIVRLGRISGPVAVVYSGRRGAVVPPTAILAAELGSLPVRRVQTLGFDRPR